MGEAGAGAFTMMKVAGHSGVMVFQRYVHLTGESVQLVFKRLQTFNPIALEASVGKKKLRFSHR